MQRVCGSVLNLVLSWKGLSFFLFVRTFIFGVPFLSFSLWDIVLFIIVLYGIFHNTLAHRHRVARTLKQAENFTTVPSSAAFTNVPCGAGIRILSIDGGGARGLIAATLMKGLEDSIRKQTGDDKVGWSDFKFNGCCRPTWQTTLTWCAV